MSTALATLRRHWPEYLIEAGALGAFMVSACAFGVLLEHPESPIRAALPDEFVRRIVMGVAMGLTAIAIIFSPWGKRSGAHMNPAFTLAFYTLGKIERIDAALYMAAQFAGGIAGVLFAQSFLGPLLGHPSINYVATQPGPSGAGAAFAGEFLISFVLMATVLLVSNHPALSRYTGVVAGFLVANYITWEAPYSGMSMNPARTFGSALPGNVWNALWLYFTAPPLAMLTAAWVYRNWRGAHRVFCAKLHHHNNERCIFRCNFDALARE
jgi:aquaporin Z